GLPATGGDPEHRGAEPPGARKDGHPIFERTPVIPSSDKGFTQQVVDRDKVLGDGLGSHGSWPRRRLARANVSVPTGNAGAGLKVPAARGGLAESGSNALRPPNRRDRPPPRLALQIHGRSPALDQAAHNREPEPRATSGGGEPGFEQSWQDVGGDPGPIIHHPAA